MKQKILIFSSSNNKDGNSGTLAKWFIEKANLEKYEFEWIYLYDYKIPLFTNENRNALLEQNRENKDIRDIINKIEAGNIFIITTPIWNFSIPAVLKNFFDRTLCSGRVWSEEKKKKISAWEGKTFYLLFTTGAPWYGLFLNILGILQVWFTLWYFGAKSKLVKIVFNCGNGAKCVVTERKGFREKMNIKGLKIFH